MKIIMSDRMFEATVAAATLIVFVLFQTLVMHTDTTADWIVAAIAWSTGIVSGAYWRERRARNSR